MFSSKSAVAHAARSTIYGIQYIRAFAAISVVMIHVAGAAGQPNYFGQIPFGGLYWNGGGEVDLFFLISGFIIVASTHDARTGLPRIGLWEFWRKRLLRIMPLVWLSVLSYAALRFATAGAIDGAEVARSLFVWPVGSVTPFVVWTIRYEFAFYAAFFVCFLLWPRARLALAIWCLFPLLLFPHAWTTAVFEWDYLRFFASPFNLEFGIGVLFGFAYNRLGPARPLPIYAPVIVALMAIMRVIAWQLDIQAGSLIMVLLIAPFLALALFYALRFTPARPSRAVVYLGDASFAIYLFHPHLVSPVMKIMAKFGEAFPVDIACVLAVVIIVPLASLAHVLLEKPLLRYTEVAYHSLSQRGARRAA